MSEENRVPCNVCREPIRPGALVCPHCHNRQKRDLGQLLSDGLKWAAGLAAFITLLLSASELNKLVEVWLEKEQAVTEYADAAQLLADSGDHVNAQMLLEKAAELSPASPQVRDLRIELAQNKLRTLLLLDRDGQNLRELKTVQLESGQKVLDFEGMYPAEEKEELENLQVAELIKLFARGTVTSDGPRKATLLAHLGWLDLLRNYGSVEYDVESSFKDALSLDSQNVYANALYAAWLLAPRNKTTLAGDERIALARKYFETALATDEQTPWVKALWLEALTIADGAVADHELLRVVQAFKDAGDSFYEHGPAIMALRRNFVHSAAWGHASDERNETRVQQLIAAFSGTDLINKANWLTEFSYGCVPGPGCGADDKEMAHILYVKGRIYLADNRLPEAVEALRLAQITGPRSYFVEAVTREHLQKALQKQNVAARQVCLYRGNAEPPLQAGDFLIKYAGELYPSSQRVAEINKTLEKDQPVAITLLRDGSLVEEQVQLIWSGDLVPYVVPEKLLRVGQWDGLKAWLTHASLPK